MHVAAAVVTDTRALIDHKLYWASVKSEAEALFVTSILNTPSLTELVRPLMSYGKDERDIDKHVWKLPIPTFDPADPTHITVVDLGRQVAAMVAALELPGQNFVTLRRQVRTAIAADPAGGAVDAAVRAMLGG